jgi:hypothetical protein
MPQIGNNTLTAKLSGNNTSGSISVPTGTWNAKITAAMLAFGSNEGYIVKINGQQALVASGNQAFTEANVILQGGDTISIGSTFGGLEYGEEFGAVYVWGFEI